MGFSAQWLELREPADHAARDGALLAAAVASAGPRPVIVDLGAGTGSTIRAMRDALPCETRWRLVDFDPALLALAAGAGAQVDTHQLDLTDLSRLPLEGASLVSASALLDLVSQEWLEALAERLARHALPFYGALSYDGVMNWEPSLPEDDDVTAAFNRDQRGTKSFGQALGPDAVAAAQAAFAAHGYQVTTSQSPWLLGPEQADLQRELIAGIADAAARAGHAGAGDWARRRIAAIGSATSHIGHIDLLALPPKAG